MAITLDKKVKAKLAKKTGLSEDEINDILNQHENPPEGSMLRIRLVGDQDLLLSNGEPYLIGSEPLSEGSEEVRPLIVNLTTDEVQEGTVSLELSDDVKANLASETDLSIDEIQDILNKHQPVAEGDELEIKLGEYKLLMVGRTHNPHHSSHIF